MRYHSPIAYKEGTVFADHYAIVAIGGELAIPTRRERRIVVDRQRVRARSPYKEKVGFKRGKHPSPV